jgi:hypothetical protein
LGASLSNKGLTHLVPAVVVVLRVEQTIAVAHIILRLLASATATPTTTQPRRSGLTSVAAQPRDRTHIDFVVGAAHVVEVYVRACRSEQPQHDEQRRSKQAHRGDAPHGHPGDAWCGQGVAASHYGQAAFSRHPFRPRSDEYSYRARDRVRWTLRDVPVARAATSRCSDNLSSNTRECGRCEVRHDCPPGAFSSAPAPVAGKRSVSHQYAHAHHSQLTPS